MDQLSDKLLNQLYSTNCPIRFEPENDRFIIDVKALANCNGGLRFSCPFCLQRKGSLNGFKRNGQMYTNSSPIFHNHGSEFGTRANHCSEAAKNFYSLSNINYEFNLCKDVSYVSVPF